MLGKTHLAVGIAATMAVTQPTSVTEMILAVGGGALGALICDIDVGTSESHRDADKIVILSAIVVLVTIVLDYFFNTDIIGRIIRGNGYGRLIGGSLLFIGICAFGKEQPHRSFMHSFLALILLSFALGLVCRSAVIYFAIGFLSHLLTDIFNKKKVRLFYPLKGGVAFGLFHAYGVADKAFLTAGSVIAMWEFILSALRIFERIRK